MLKSSYYHLFVLALKSILSIKNFDQIITVRTHVLIFLKASFNRIRHFYLINFREVSRRATLFFLWLFVTILGLGMLFITRQNMAWFNICSGFSPPGPLWLKSIIYQKWRGGLMSPLFNLQKDAKKLLLRLAD